MCGIVGILGKGPVAEQLVDALKRLEYRGYDSAGIATRRERRARSPSRRRQAAQSRGTARSARRSTARTGIGHTRWATHGAPTEANAHPHATDRVAVVHNGIIENFRELKDELTAQGAIFTSDTDTEVVAHLDHARADDRQRSGARRVPRAAAAEGRVRAGHDVRGRERPDDRRAPGQPARHRLWRRRDVRRLRRDRARALHRPHRLSRGRRLGGGDARPASPSATATARRSSAPMTRSLASALLIDKGNYRHFMAKEIHEQPEVIGHTLAGYVDLATSRVDIPATALRLRQCSARLSLSACGTAYYAGLVAKYWFERWARLPVDVDIASEFRYRETAARSGRRRAVRLAVGRDRRYARHAALLPRAGSAHRLASSMCANPRSRANPTRSCRHWPGRRSASPRPRPSPASSRCSPASPSPPARRAARIGPALEDRTRAGAGRGRRAMMATVLRDERPYEALAQQLSKARDVLYLGRGSMLPDRARRRAEAQGDFLHSRRGLCRRRAEARADRADRREHAGHRHRPARRPLREDRVQHAGGRGARRQDRAGERRRPSEHRLHHRRRISPCRRCTAS